MAKTNNLKDFLIDLYEGISSKKPNASRNPQDFRSEIESISGGATIKSGGWQGTKFNVGDYVENLYFNTNLSIEEVYKICDSLKLDGTTEYMGLLYVDEKNNMVIVVDYREVFGDGVSILVNIDGFSSYLFNTNKSLEQAEGVSSEGWLADVPSDFPYPVNSNVIGSFDGGDGLVFTIPDVDTSQLISTTPFTNETIELSGEYDGSTIEVTDLSGGWQGTNIVNGRFVEKLYFNTNLSIEEVYAICDSLTMENIGNEVYCLYADTNYEIYIFDYREQVNDGVLIMGANADFSVVDLIFSTSQTAEQMLGIAFVDGWYTNNALEVNNTCSASNSLGFTVNPNDTSQLVSTTPFTHSEENTINIKKYIDEKKIPLSIKVNVEGTGGGTGGGESEDYPSEAIAYYKQTRNKNYPYLPLPYEMEETETQDTIYMLYDANGYMCCPAFYITFTECVCTIQKYMNTTLVSEYVENVTSGTTKYLQFSEEDSDYSTYNYIVIKMQGNITKHYLNYAPMFNGVSYNNNSGTELIEVSGKCNNCDTKMTTHISNLNNYPKHSKLEFFSFTGLINNNGYLLENCYNLRCVAQLEMNNFTYMSGMFYNCYSLQIIPQLDTSNVEMMDSIFYGCYSLKIIPQLNTKKVTTMRAGFYNCYSLREIPQLDTSNVKDMYENFYNCYSLQEIPQLDMSNVTSTTNMFSNCYILAKLNIYNAKTSFNLSYSTMLSQSELVKILNNLATVTSTKTLTVGSTNLAKLTDEQKAIATNKGWTLA